MRSFHHVEYLLVAAKLDNPWRGKMTLDLQMLVYVHIVLLFIGIYPAHSLCRLRGINRPEWRQPALTPEMRNLFLAQACCHLRLLREPVSGVLPCAGTAHSRQLPRPGIKPNNTEQR